MASLPKSFKAIRCAKPDDPWELVTIPMRDPAASEVLIRVHASGICNSDHFVKSGTWPGLQYPRTPGHEVVGHIAALGSALQQNDRFKLGALAGVGWNGGYCNHCEFCRLGEFWTCKNGGFTGFSFDGGHAEYIFAPDTAVVSLPQDALETSSYAELAPLLCAGATVYDAIRTTTFNPGDLCVVQGIGGLGHLAVQFASKMGLKVYALSSGSSKRDLALSLGAHEYIDGSSTDAVALLQSLGGARVIVCTAPHADQISSIIPAVAKNGTVTLVSAATDKPVNVWNLTLNMNRASIRGWCCGCAQDMEQCVRFTGLKKIKAMVQEFRLEDFSKAYEGVVENTARFRNVIVFP